MIKSFSHKGLELYYRTGDMRGIQPKHANRLGRILDSIEAAEELRDINRPGYELHGLKGELAGYWSVKVSANWRITFLFEDGNAFFVNYSDYH